MEEMERLRKFTPDELRMAVLQRKHPMDVRSVAHYDENLIPFFITQNERLDRVAAIVEKYFESLNPDKSE